MDFNLMDIFFFFQPEAGIRDYKVTGVQTCALPIFPRRSRPLPARERLRPGPRASGRTRPLVHVTHARFDLVEEALDPLSPLRKDARREAVLRLVGLRDRLLEPRHLANRQDRHEQLLDEG